MSLLPFRLFCIIRAIANLPELFRMFPPIWRQDRWRESGSGVDGKRRYVLIILRSTSLTISYHIVV